MHDRQPDALLPVKVEKTTLASQASGANTDSRENGTLYPINSQFFEESFRRGWSALFGGILRL